MGTRDLSPRKFYNSNGQCTDRFNFCAVLWWALVLASIAGLGYLIYALPNFQDVDTHQEFPADWFKTQKTVSVNAIFANFGSAGAKAYNASQGILLDSALPDPRDHLWTRIRDSSLVFKTLIDRFVINGDEKLRTAINNYITAQAAVQKAQSRSGNLTEGNSAANEPYSWQLWHQPSIDFWSSIRKVNLVDSVFGRAVQHHTLFKGAVFARVIRKECPICETQAPQILCTMQSFRKVGEDKSTIVPELVNTEVSERSGRDTSTILGSVLNFDLDAECNDETFQPCSQPMLRKHKEVVDSFRGWSINNGVGAGKAVATGRFPEDGEGNDVRLPGGNAWYVGTLAAAGQLYDALWAYDKFGSITIGDASLPFWQAIYPDAEKGL
ncbi:hypothetical protein BU23DRAFT_626501 [Bimuria novae-zelandiae CBS 107.79]|uniref:1,4-alpha-D-glucan glucohydrolase n=1 Tax=Bimuria novae-zelandiae CBS 107.79 TaxID=1447943 RepID=A0A6A5VJM5_9PLEO|nr:hypothetical protein BU23DRAFT_626501 [Bimuria novae-zelandiae CBS 107.79]